MEVFVKGNVSQEERDTIVAEEVAAFKGKVISTITITEENDELIIKTVEKSPIRRLRRITGYLSSLDNFNDAKRQEASQRQAHIKV